MCDSNSHNILMWQNIMSYKRKLKHNKVTKPGELGILSWVSYLSTQKVPDKKVNETCRTSGR